MVCPICHRDSSEIKNNNYFCPVCNIYIGPVNAGISPAYREGSRSLSNPPLPRAATEKPFIPPQERIRMMHQPKPRNWKKIVIRCLVLCVPLYLVLRLFFYIDPVYGCYVFIAPSWIEFSNANIVRSIGIVRNISIDDYRNFCQRVNIIDPAVSCGGFDGGCHMWSEPRKIYVSTGQRSVVLTAAIIVHEVCHSIQNSNGKMPDEDECYKADNEFIKKVTQI